MLTTKLWTFDSVEKDYNFVSSDSILCIVNRIISFDIYRKSPWILRFCPYFPLRSRLEMKSTIHVASGNAKRQHIGSRNGNVICSALLISTEGAAVAQCLALGQM